MKIAIDLDDTITASKSSVEFFRIITQLLIPEHDIVIISNRNESDREDVEEYLSVLGIRYNKVVLTQDKASYILKHNIHLLFEDTDEYFQVLPESVLVFKVREEGNFNFKSHKWIGSQKTVDLIDE